MEGNNAFHDGFFSVQTAAAQLHAKMGQALPTSHMDAFTSFSFCSL
jgi:hypothetical protein